MNREIKMSYDEWLTLKYALHNNIIDRKEYLRELRKSDSLYEIVELDINKEQKLLNKINEICSELEG